MYPMDLFKLQDELIEHKEPKCHFLISLFIEAAGDIFREMCKEYAFEGYVREKINKLRTAKHINKADMNEIYSECPNVYFNDYLKKVDYLKSKIPEAFIYVEPPYGNVPIYYRMKIMREALKLIKKIVFFATMRLSLNELINAVNILGNHIEFCYSKYRKPLLLNYIPKSVIEIMDLLDAVLVGGTIRDLVMGKKPHDYDIATPLTPSVISMKIKLDLPKVKIYDVGMRFGTVGLVVDNMVIEATTFRKELYDFTSRKPVVIYTTDILEDLSRRDFTINAMAMDVMGFILDPFGGMEDLDKGVIRFVGEPKYRIMEDPLRILRGARFASKLGFKIDPLSYNAMFRYVKELKRISKERIRDEMLKAMDTRRFAEYCEVNCDINAFDYYGDTWKKVIKDMIGTRHDILSRYHHGETVWEHTLEVLSRMDLWKYEPKLKLVGLLHDVGKPYTMEIKRERIRFIGHDKKGAELVVKMMKELKFSNRDILYVRTLVSLHSKFEDAIEHLLVGNKKPMARFIGKIILNNINPEWVIDLLKFTCADLNIPKVYDKILKAIEPALSVKKPKMTPEMIERIPVKQRKNYLFSLIVQKVLRKIAW